MEKDFLGFEIKSDRISVVIVSNSYADANMLKDLWNEQKDSEYRALFPVLMETDVYYTELIKKGEHE